MGPWDSPSSRWLLLFLGLVVAVLLGAVLPTIDIVLVIGGLVVIAIAAISLFSFRSYPPYVVPLLAILAGYALGGRGFSNLRVPGTALYVGELLILVFAGYMAATIPFRRQKLLQGTFFEKLVLVFMAYGFLRLCFSLRDYDALTAIRDSASWYYGAFFVVGAYFSRSPRNVGLLFKLLLGIGLIYPAWGALNNWWPGLLQRLSVSGYPLIMLKGDHLGMNLAMATLLLLMFAKLSSGLWKMALTGWAAVAFAMTAFGMARAAYVGLLFGMVFLTITYSRWLLGRMLLFLPVGFVAASVVFLVAESGSQDEQLGVLLDEVVSIVDVGGRRDYATASGAMSSDNNEYRLEWWGYILKEVVPKSPLVGTGFGADITTNFMVRRFGPAAALSGDDDAPRSPHSIHFTILARMGLVGLMLWATLIGAYAFHLLRAIFAARRAKDSTRAWLLASVSGLFFIILGTASFGVLIEGPFAGIWFWFIMGVGSALGRWTPEHSEAFANAWRFPRFIRFSADPASSDEPDELPVEGPREDGQFVAS